MSSLISLITTDLLHPTILLLLIVHQTTSIIRTDHVQNSDIGINQNETSTVNNRLRLYERPRLNTSFRLKHHEQVEDDNHHDDANGSATLTNVFVGVAACVFLLVVSIAGACWYRKKRMRKIQMGIIKTKAKDQSKPKTVADVVEEHSSEDSLSSSKDILFANMVATTELSSTKMKTASTQGSSVNKNQEQLTT